MYSQPFLSVVYSPLSVQGEPAMTIMKAYLRTLILSSLNHGSSFNIPCERSHKTDVIFYH